MNDEQTIKELRETLARAEATLALLWEWTRLGGRALCPPRADTYGEGMLDAKEQVSRILAAKKPT